MSVPCAERAALTLVPTATVQASSGAQLTLCFNFRALYAFEAATGRQMLAPDSAPQPALIRAFLWSLLIEFHPHLKQQDVSHLWGIDEVLGIVECGVHLVVSGVPQAKPTPAAAQPSPKPTDWLGLWAMARYDLRLTEGEFWSMTPSMFDALVQRVAAQNPDAAPVGPPDAKALLAKIEAANAMMGGKDLRKK